MTGTGQLWSPAKTARMKALHYAGLSARQIGEDLHLSRNAVLGKIHRLGMSKPAALLVTPMSEPRPDSCQFPFGDPGDPDFHFCGKRRARLDTSYCQQHHDLCYRPNPKKDVAA